VIHRYLLFTDLPLPDPYIVGVTESRRPSPILINARFRSEKQEVVGYHSESQIFESRYSWIPTTFQVSDDGMDIHIQDYINGLGPRNDFPTLYRLIEKLFLLALPHFEKTLAHQFTPSESPSGMSVSKYQSDFSCFTTHTSPTMECKNADALWMPSENMESSVGETSNRKGARRESITSGIGGEPGL
jgi:hypothetical protein